jgi:four helix bundle protein
MTQNKMKARTVKFALRIIRLVENPPNNKTSGVLGHQLLRSGTSVGSNYQASCRAKSRADFVSKLAIVEKEADESIYWMELLIESGQIKKNLADNLMQEAHEILSIVAASIKTIKQKRDPKSQIQNPKSKI